MVFSSCSASLEAAIAADDLQTQLQDTVLESFWFLNPKPQTPNPKPQTLNPKPLTLDPKPESLKQPPKPSQGCEKLEDCPPDKAPLRIVLGPRV